MQAGEATLYASGDWHVRAGEEGAFVKRWAEFLSWTRDNVAGFEGARLIRSVDDPAHFVSFAHWQSEDARTQWKSLPAFSDKFGACRALCDAFTGGDFDLAASV